MPNYCERDWHDGTETPATFLLLEAASADHGRSYAPSALGVRFACCAEHVERALTECLAAAPGATFVVRPERVRAFSGRHTRAEGDEHSDR